ncbi:MAG TPA: DHH family phosphoesterase, partial [archaeon]|nr:DHH family phosphoesterase [archaeon]
MFLEELEKISKIFKSIVKEKNVKIIHHLDADGISSAAIIAKMMLRENIGFEMRMVKQLTSEIIKELVISEKDFLIFLDLGSGQLKLLKEILEATQVLILDHHEFAEMEHPNLFHLNPLLFAEEEISSSMICYLFAKSVDLKNTDIVDLAIVGAVGDQMDEKWEFKGMAKKIIEEAENIGKVNTSKGIRLYGRSRPIHKALELSFDPFIPNISGSESNAIQFLSELGIELKENNEWKRLADLSIEEQQKIASAIIIERLKAKHSDADDIFGDIYTISGRPEELQDAREFATILNACGRLNKPDIGVKLCLNDIAALNASEDVLSEYKRMISEGISWIKDNKESIRKTKFATYIFCGDKIPSTLVGTITSIFLNSNLIDTGKP